MNLKFWQEKPSIYDEPIAGVLTKMNMYTADDPEYPALLAALERLTALKDKKNIMRISPDTLAIVLGNLVGIGIIVFCEYNHPLNSKGFNFIKQKTP